MADTRLFQHFFLPLGFVQERGDAFDNSVEYQKSELLDWFLQPLDAIDTSKVLNVKLIKVFQKRIQAEKLEINFFNDLCFLFSNYTSEPAPPSQMLAHDLVRQKALIGTAKDAQLSFYIDLCECIRTTMLQFTELDAIGSGEHLMDDYKSMVDGFYALLPKTTSYNLFMEMQAIIYFMFEMLKAQYKINTMESDFYDKCVEMFNSEIAEDIGSVIFLTGELQKQTKKIKKIKPKVVDLAKEVIHSYILVLLQLRAFNKDSM